MGLIVVNLGRDNDARLLRLRTALGLGSGFQLVLVEAEPGPIRKEVVRRIQTWSGSESIGALPVVSLDPDVTLAAQLGGKSGAIVTGLEPPSPTEPPARDWIAELNWSRDALPGLVPGPLVLVVSQAMHQVLFERASDLYSWRRHTARVTITARELAVPLSSPGDRYWLQERERLSSILSEVALSPFKRDTLLLDLAKVLLQLGDEHGASHALDEVFALRGSPADDEEQDLVLAYGKLGRVECALVRRDFVAATKLLDELLPAAYDDELEASLALLRGRIHAAAGEWDAARMELLRAVEIAGPSWQLLAQAGECLFQIAFAQGDIARARREIGDLLENTWVHLEEWGAGMLLRLSGVIVDMYPDEVARLLEAVFVDAESSSKRATMIAIERLRVKRAWLLARAEPAREALARAKRLACPEDAAELHASLSLCEAEVALAAGSTSEDDVARPLTHACELFRSTAPRQAAIAGVLLGNFWRRLQRSERAVAAYQVAAEDARAAGDVALVTEAELGGLGAAVGGEIEPEDVLDRLRMLADGFQRADHTQSEGVARTDLGRCLLRRGLREAAVMELDRARACFAATTDADGERSVVRLLDAVS